MGLPLPAHLRYSFRPPPIGTSPVKFPLAALLDLARAPPTLFPLPAAALASGEAPPLVRTAVANTTVRIGTKVNSQARLIRTLPLAKLGSYRCALSPIPAHTDATSR